MTKPVHLKKTPTTPNILQSLVFYKKVKDNGTKHSPSFTEEECYEADTFIEVSEVRHQKMVA